jgi:hypothetical protein
MQERRHRRVARVAQIIFLPRLGAMVLTYAHSRFERHMGSWVLLPLAASRMTLPTSLSSASYRQAVFASSPELARQSIRLPQWPHGMHLFTRAAYRSQVPFYQRVIVKLWKTIDGGITEPRQDC